jgi:uncharacterized protein
MAKTTKKTVATPKSEKKAAPAPKKSVKPAVKTSPEKEVKKKETKTVKPAKDKVETKPVKKVAPIKTAPKKPAPSTGSVKKEKEKAPVTKPAAKKAITEKAPDEKKAPAGSTKEPVIKPLQKSKVDFSDVKGEVTVEKKLMALYNLQQIDSQVDKIRIIRGELPLEVQDLEDEIAGLETRIENYVLETVEHDKIMREKEQSILESQSMIKKYEEQQMNVRNNREYDSLTKEIEFQNLEIQLAQKRIREAQMMLEAKKEEITQYQKLLQDRKNDLEVKKNELDDIVTETEKEENELIKQSENNRNFIEERLITAYTRIRKNARNGLAVVQIERDACGGCFNKIPPQHQLDIRMHKKIIVCEYCGRILVDDIIVDAVH